MIVWSGRGILAPLVFIASMFLFVILLGESSIKPEYPFIAAFTITGFFSYFMGKKWNTQEGRTFIDKASGQEVTIRPNHSLFWIPMQYWGFISIGLAIVIAISTLVS